MFFIGFEDLCVYNTTRLIRQMTTISIFRSNLQAILLTGMQVGPSPPAFPQGTGQQSRINQEHRQA